jgi:soluble lytic murein transglycosylase-like protein
MGHVLAQRYLTPSFRAKYSDLTSWLAQYADHPDAGKVYALAMKRRGGGGLPRPPTYTAGNLPENVELQMLASAARAAQSPWDSGLERFRAGRYGEAAQQFERVAMTPGLSPWTASAGAFWAARSYLRAGEPQQVNRWMNVAAQQPRTFYGLLALHHLGIDPPLNWKVPSAGDTGFKQVLSETPGKRALALIEAQDNDRAERELLGLRTNATTDELLALATVAQEAHLPALSMKIGRQLLDKGVALDAALFPIPGWQPEGGFRVDRALVYALMRQESGFNPQAMSPVGARGLMQLMPATAQRYGVHNIMDPAENILGGVKYLRDLLQMFQGNLELAVAAYNAGENAVIRYGNRVPPYAETAHYVPKVLSFYKKFQNRQS